MINQAHIDRFTAVHFATGAAMGLLGVGPLGAAMISVGFELVEDSIKDSRFNIFPYASHDTKQNSLTDALATSAGAYVVMRYKR